MLSKLRSRLTYANVMATIAVFLALGGTSYAAYKITGRDVRDGSLTGADIADNSVTGQQIRGIRGRDVSDGSLLARDFAAGQLPRGPRGPAGAPGSSKVTYVKGGGYHELAVCSGREKDVTLCQGVVGAEMHCPPGAAPISGGITGPSGHDTSNIELRYSEPELIQDAQPDTWYIEALVEAELPYYVTHNLSGGFTSVAVCIS